MNRQSVVLEYAASEAPFASHSASATGDKPVRSSEYTELIRRLFHRPSAVAIVGSGVGCGVTGVAETIAAEVATSGRRVVVVPVDGLFQMDPITVPDPNAFTPGRTQNVWFWPTQLGQDVESFKSRKSAGGSSWMASLRETFESILLVCSSLQPGTEDVSAMADATVLIVEAGRTPKQQLRRDRRSLQLRGATLAGCILIRGK